MKSKGIKVLNTFILAAATILSAVISHYATVHYGTTDGGATERERLRHQAEQANQELSATKASLLGVETKLSELQVGFDATKMKYEKCTRLVGRTFTSSSTDTSPSEEKVETGDNIEFKLTSSSMSAHVNRITPDGPVFVLNNCAKPGILKAIKSESDGDHAYLIRRGEKLEFSVSSRCCEQGIGLCDASDLEKIVIECLEFDTEKQESVIRYGRTIGG
jgi:hypothetical protein